MSRERKRRREAERLFESLPPEFFEMVKQVVKKEILEELLAKVKQQVRVGGSGGRTAAGDLNLGELGVKDHDLLDGLGDDDHTQYFRADGTRELAGNIIPDTDNAYNLGKASPRKQFSEAYIGYLKMGGDLMLTYSSTNWLKLTNWAASAYKNLVLSQLSCKNALYAANYSYDGGDFTISSYWGNGYEVAFKQYDGGAYSTVAKMKDDDFRILRGGDITMLDQKMLTIGTYTDAQRPAAGTTGRVIFNTDDGMPNYDDGTNWRDINGNIT